MKTINDVSLLFTAGLTTAMNRGDNLREKIQAIANASEDERLQTIERQLEEIAKEKRQQLKTLGTHLNVLLPLFQNQASLINKGSEIKTKITQLLFTISGAEKQIKKEQDAYRIRLGVIYREKADKLGQVLGLKSALATILKKKIYEKYVQAVNAKSNEMETICGQFNEELQGYAEINEFRQLILRSQDLMNQFSQISLTRVFDLVDDLARRLKLSPQALRELNENLKRNLGSQPFANPGSKISPSPWVKSLEDYSNEVRAEVEVLHAQQWNFSDIQALKDCAHEIFQEINRYKDYHARLILPVFFSANSVRVHEAENGQSLKYKPV